MDEECSQDCSELSDPGFGFREGRLAWQYCNKVSTAAIRLHYLVPAHPREHSDPALDQAEERWAHHTRRSVEAAISVSRDLGR